MEILFYAVGGFAITLVLLLIKITDQLDDQLRVQKEINQRLIGLQYSISKR